LNTSTPEQRPAATARASTPGLRIERINPLAHEAGLKAFMAANSYAAFADLFDRGYRATVADGGASWVGFDGAGVIQMSVTQFVHRFEFRGTHLVAGVLGDLMVGLEYRTFFPALSLMRRMLRDTRERGELDFVYSDPNPGATAIATGAKLDHVGDLDRTVLPFADWRPPQHAAAWLYSTAMTLRAGPRAKDVRCYPAPSFDLTAFGRPFGPSDRILGHHPLSMLRRRLPEFPAALDHVVEVRLERGAAAWDALVLLRVSAKGGIVSICSIRRRADVPLRTIIPALVPIARQIGGYRLQIETLRGSAMEREFAALGFRTRGDLVPIFAKAFTPAGEDACRNVAHWEMTTVDVER
jgi:hypothetical protein